MLSVLGVHCPRPLPAADFPFGPGVGFAPFSLSPGQIVSVTALNVEPPGIASPSKLASGSCAGGIIFESYDAEGKLRKRTALKNLQPGKSTTVELSRRELTKRPASIEIRAVILFGYRAGTLLDRGAARIL